jgi:putative membrane protein
MGSSSVLFGLDDVGPLRWHAHPEVWLLVATVIALGIYVDRVIAPKIPASERGDGPAISRRQKGWFIFGVLLLWGASDWPMHDVAEQYLYSVHMVQHTILTLVMPPVFWMATPPWLARLVVAPGTRGYATLQRFARPVVAAVIFNALVLFSHWPAVVNFSVANGPFHYSLHLVLVSAAFLMWIPVCGPWRELQLSEPGKCVYLFAQSIIPTVPGAWLAMADQPIFTAYDHLPRMFELSAMDDQMIAGFFMKLGAGSYLWAVIIVIFFRWAFAQERSEKKNYIVKVEDGIDYRPPAHRLPEHSQN